jgi:hypothetical protein
MLPLAYLSYRGCGDIGKMKQYHFRLKAGNYSNSYYITDSNRDRAFDSAQWEFFKDCEAQGFVAMSCLLEFEEVNEI